MNVREQMRAKQAAYDAEKKKVAEANKAEAKTRAEFQAGWHKAMEDKRKNVREKYKGQTFDRHNRPDKKDFLKINSGEILVETSGFIPVSEQVNRFERAGVNLRAEMEKKYDYGVIDDDRDGFRDGALQQYPDKIESFDMLQDAQIAALKAKRKEREDAEQKLKEYNKTPEKVTEPVEPQPETGNGEESS